MVIHVLSILLLLFITIQASKVYTAEVKGSTDNFKGALMTQPDIAKFDPNMAFPESKLDHLNWLNPKTSDTLRVCGLAWYGTDKTYRRMPVNTPEPLPNAVNNLANHTSGTQIRFRTNSKELAIRVTLPATNKMAHMASTGQNGVDVYWGIPGQKMQFINTAMVQYDKPVYELLLYNQKNKVMRDVTLNLPLYQGVKEILIGFDKDAEILPPQPYKNNKCLIFYGTSITQGGCASRPGMSYTNILSRRMNYEFINLGFSGSGKGEPVVAQTIASITNLLCFVLDYERNATGNNIYYNTLPNVIKTLREKHPSVPIIVFSCIKVAKDYIADPDPKWVHNIRDFAEKTVTDLRTAGDTNIYFVDGRDILGPNWDECTVDGLHPTDLGFMRMADAFEPELKKILKLE